MTHSNETKRLLGAALAVGLLLLAPSGCQKKSSEASESTNSAEKPSESTQQAPGQESAEAKSGVAAIDHGGITSIPTDDALAKQGKKVFKTKGCPACHKMDKKLVGPALGGVTERRDPKWIARMIMHPEKMLDHDETAKSLLAKHMTPMPNQNVKPDEAKALIAYLATQK